MGIRSAKRRIFYSLPWSLSGLVYKLATGSMGFARQFRNSRVGKNSYIDPSVQVIGWKNVSIGHNTTLSEDSWLNVNFRDDTTKRIVIGNNCHIGRRNFFSSGSLIEIKDYGFTGLDCHFLGCGHNIESPLTPYIASGLDNGGVIELGVNCWLATSVTVLQNVKIGCGSVIGARSLVTRDLPPFSVAIGNPCIVIKRFDFKNSRWVKLADWVDDLEKYQPSEDEYLQSLKDKYSDIQPSLLSGSRSFGWL
ncbi:putative acetyltransferase [mine drainage metagenome]|uniref:Putative acetyltransferase n=1 Tax=mine drainage metagenome TaxID=410659 RepID=A0A1J5RUX6_9ZZZZ